MTRPAANPTFLRRVANVTVVALCTASSLALLGAVPAEWAKNRISPEAIVARSQQPAADAPQADESFAQLAAYPFGPLIDADFVLEAREADEIIEAAALPAIATTTAPATRVMRMEVTAYCPCTKCCGSNAQGITASGKLVDYNGGKFVAADTRVLPFGKKLVIPGYADGAAVEVIDRGGAIKGNRLDLYFPTHEEALIWGRQHLDVTVYE